MEPSTRFIDQLKGESDQPIKKNKIGDVLDYHAGALVTMYGSLVEPKEPATCFQGRRLTVTTSSTGRPIVQQSTLYEVYFYRKLMDKATAKEMWNAVLELFQALSEGQLFLVCKNLFLFSWTETNDVAMHANF